MPEGFRVLRSDELGGASDEDFWYLPFWDQTLFPRSGAFVGMVGRLRPGISEEAAATALELFAARQWGPPRGRGTAWLPPEDRAVGCRAGHRREAGCDTHVSQRFLLMLLIASANVAHLILARSVGRRRDWLVKRAIGATRGLLVRESLTEVLVLAGAGALLGVATTRLIVGGLIRASPTYIAGLETSIVDPQVLLFSVGVTGLAVLVTGVGPALHVKSLEAAGVLTSRSGGDSRWHQRYRSGLVIAEVALAMVLLGGTVLLAGSLNSLVQIDPGFDPTGVVKVEVEPMSKDYPTPEARAALWREIHTGFASIPGADAVGGGNPLPFGSIQRTSVGITQEGGEILELPVGLRQWLPGSCEALGMTLSTGRCLDWEDMSDLSDFKVVVDRRLARAAWPDADPLGQTVRVERREYGPDGDIWMQPYWAEVVGVVEPIQGVSLAEVDPPTVFVAFHQNPWADVDFVVRTRDDPQGMFESMRDVLARIDPRMPLRGERLVVDDVAASLDRLRVSATVIGVFGSLSTFLALFGLYALTAHDVTRRRPEIGLRMALGATPSTVRRTVVSRAIRTTVIGVALGLPVSYVVTRVLGRTWEEVTPGDPEGLLLGAALLLVCGALAALVPAAGASRIDPSRVMIEH